MIEVTISVEIKKKVRVPTAGKSLKEVHDEHARAMTQKVEDCFRDDPDVSASMTSTAVKDD